MTRARRISRSAIAALLSAAVVAGVAVGASTVMAETPPKLPAVTAQDLVASSLTALSGQVSISGDVQTKLDLGVPEIPASLSGAAGGAGITSALASLIGTQHYRVWSSPDGLRVQHLADFQEQDLIVNQTEAWFWDSATSTATRLRTADLASTLPAPPAQAQAQAQANVQAEVAQMANLDPTTLAAKLLQGASTCGDVSVSGTAVVAGRDAYLLSFTPTSTTTLVGRATVAIDAATRLPLDVQIVPRGSVDPAMEAGFTSVSFDAIDPVMFAFTPPPGATVKDVTDQIAGAAQPPAGEPVGYTPGGSSPGGPQPVTAGSCLDLSFAVPLGAPLPKEAASLLPYAGPLVSAITVERGGTTWLLVGSVDPATLQQRADAIP